MSKIIKNDQSVKQDKGKPQLTLVPLQILTDVARVREYGVAKYGNNENWKKVEIQRYRDAAFRHFVSYLEDPQGVDEESGLPHLSHLACNVAFLCALEEEEKKKAKEELDTDSDWVQEGNYVKLPAIKEISPSAHSKFDFKETVKEMLDEAGYKK